MPGIYSTPLFAQAAQKATDNAEDVAKVAEEFSILQFVDAYGQNIVWGSCGGLIVILLVMMALVRVPLNYNVRNLVLRWRTTLMTAMAFTMVLALLTVMLAFVGGMQRLTQQSGQPGNVIILSEGSTDETFSNLGYSNLSNAEEHPLVLTDNGKKLCSKEVYLIINQPIENPQPGAPKRRFLQIRGIDDAEISGTVHGMQMLPGGRWFSQSGVQTVEGKTIPAVEVVLGEGLAKAMGKDRSPEQLATAKNKGRLEVGDTFAMHDRPWIVVGVMTSSGSTFDSELWAKRTIVGPLFGKNTYTTFVVRSANATDAAALVKYYTTDFKQAAVSAMLETKYFEAMSQLNKQFLIAALFVTGVLAIGGIFGVMNTMFAAISQRIKDIGVLGLLGFSRPQILISFLIESLVIALVGGLLGCLLGSLSHGWTASSIVSSGAGGGKSVVLKLTVDTNVLAGGLLVTLLMGTLGGIVPAISALRKRPLESLR